MNSSRLAGVVDGGELLRQIQVIPADNAILDKALASLGELLILFFGVQKLPWAANGQSAGEAWPSNHNSEASTGD